MGDDLFSMYFTFNTMHHRANKNPSRQLFCLPGCFYGLFVGIPSRSQTMPGFNYRQILFLYNPLKEENSEEFQNR